MGKRRKQQQQMIEDVPVDKMDLFLQNNYKKLLIGIAALLVVFLAGYAFKNISESKDQMMVSKIGQQEMMFTLSGASENELLGYVDMSLEYPKLGDYINLKAAEVLVSNGKEGADKYLANVGGDLKEVADGLRFDTGAAGVNPEAYLNGKMSALWYYRAYLAAEGAKKEEIMNEFGKKFPNNELFKQIERWNG